MVGGASPKNPGEFIQAGTSEALFLHYCLTNTFLGGNDHALGEQGVFEITKKAVSVNTLQALLKSLDPI